MTTLSKPAKRRAAKSKPRGGTALAIDKSSAVRRQVGQPSKYRPEYCAGVIKCGKTGASLTAFAASIGVGRRTIHNWEQTHEAFADACEIAKAHACAWWETKMREVASGDGGPGAATVAMFGVKNFGRQDFEDRRQMEHVGQVAHTLMTYDQALEEARRRGLPERIFEE
jgi:hypothetical protein